ncbi:hypothetical protein [Moraxella macacae]|uniref:hypothetical protein n=1 Tax=Moraxella macacae TaxID=765840 RepID=UPI00030F9AA8|nr:hypothetical protein [Moraxella macacae]
MTTKQDNSKQTLTQPTDMYTVSYEEADSVGAEYITQSELEAMGFSVDDIKQEADDE